jgi:hypothetical protein
MLTFMENADNWKIIDGGAAKGAPQTGVPITRISGFELMAKYVSKKAKDTNWKALTAQGHWMTFKKLYKKNRAKTTRTGWGVTQEDINCGICTIDAKLEELCPYYKQMDAIYGEKLNVSPTNIQNIGALETPHEGAHGDITQAEQDELEGTSENGSTKKSVTDSDARSGKGELEVVNGAIARPEDRQTVLERGPVHAGLQASRDMLARGIPAATQADTLANGLVLIDASNPAMDS